MIRIHFVKTAWKIETCLLRELHFSQNCTTVCILYSYCTWNIEKTQVTLHI
jgi:hypothetical protein